MEEIPIAAAANAATTPTPKVPAAKADILAVAIPTSNPNIVPNLTIALAANIPKSAIPLTN